MSHRIKLWSPFLHIVFIFQSTRIPILQHKQFMIQYVGMSNFNFVLNDKSSSLQGPFSIWKCTFSLIQTYYLKKHSENLSKNSQYAVLFNVICDPGAFGLLYFQNKEKYQHDSVLKQGSLFSKAYHPLAQPYFSTGPLPPPLLAGGPLLCPFLGVLFCINFFGESSSTSTSRGSSSMSTSWGSSSTSTSGGVLFCHHLWGVLCDLSHNALIYCYRIPQCIMDKIHMGPPQSWTEWQTNMTENITFPHTTYVGSKYVNPHLFSLLSGLKSHIVRLLLQGIFGNFTCD